MLLSRGGFLLMLFVTVITGGVLLLVVLLVVLRLAGCGLTTQTRIGGTSSLCEHIQIAALGGVLFSF